MSILFGIIIGVVTTVIGSWVVSRIHLYQEARNAHRDEIKEKFWSHCAAHPMTRPTSFSSPPNSPRGAMTTELPRNRLRPNMVMSCGYRGRLSAQQSGVDRCAVRRRTHSSSSGPHGRLAEPHEFMGRPCRSMAARSSITRRRTCVSASGIQPFPPKIRLSRPYVRHLTLAVFIQARLQGTGETSLRVVRAGNEALLTDGSANLASGSFEQMQKLLTWINDKMVSARPLANRLALEFGELQAECAEVSRQFSLAIAAKKLSRDCPLVRFW